MKVSIIIKTLNEEENIGRAIKSAIKAVKGIDHEIILADSLSTDKTVEIAKKYPIKIVQLVNAKDRSCGIGAQLGYLRSKGDYIYILDGDMELSKDFIRQGIKELEAEKDLAGVGGIINEMTTTNIVFRRRKKGKGSKVDKPVYASSLPMGGLYKREAIENVDYFSNPDLHAYEEFDLGARLGSLGYKFKRIPVSMIKHYGDKLSSFSIMLNRWRMKFHWASGELIRYHFNKPTFFTVLREVKLYLFVIFWWFWLILSFAFLKYSSLLLKVQLLSTALFLILFSIKKRQLSEVVFSIFSWNLAAFGLICGLFEKRKNIKRRINAIKIK